MEVDDRVKEDIQEEDVLVEEIAREPIKTKSQLTREAKQAITYDKSYPHKPMKQDKEQQYRRLIDLIKQLDVTIAFTDPIDMMSEYSKLLKDLITNKKSLKNYGIVTFEEDYSAILENTDNFFL